MTLRIRPVFVVLALLTAAGPMAGCVQDAKPARAEASAAHVVPGRFQRLDALLRRGRIAAAGNDAAAVSALRGPLSTEGMALLRARIPNDLRRQDMPRFLDARQGFGTALSHWVGAIERQDMPAMLAAFGRLDDATQGWIDAYLGRPTETAL